MGKDKKRDINDLILEGHKLGIQSAKEIASRTNTSLIVVKKDKIVALKPKYKYVRVPNKKQAKASVKKKAKK